MFCVICCSFGLIFGQSGSGKTTLLQVDLFLYVFSSEVLYVQFVNTLFFSYIFLSVCPFLSQLLAGLSKPTSGSFYFKNMGMMANQMVLLSRYSLKEWALCFSFQRSIKTNWTFYPSCFL